jgi:hypothetical protein
MFFLKKLLPYIFSLIIFSFSSLFFITISVIAVSYLYKKIGDSSSWDSGFNSWNPFDHIEPLFFIFFIFTGLLIFKHPPFYFTWDSGYKGFLQRMAYFLLPVLFHLLIGFMILFIGVFIYKLNFLLASLSMNSFVPEINSKSLFAVMQLIQVKGPSLVFSLFLLYSVSINVFLSVTNFFFSIIHYFIQYSIFGDGYKEKMISIIAFFIFIFFFGSYIYSFLWKCILFPTILFFYK